MDVLYTIKYKVGNDTELSAHRDQLYVYAQKAFDVTPEQHRRYMAIVHEEKVIFSLLCLNGLILLSCSRWEHPLPFEVVTLHPKLTIIDEIFDRKKPLKTRHFNWSVKWVLNSWTYVPWIDSKFFEESLLCLKAFILYYDLVQAI